MNADISTLKRSFADVGDQGSEQLHDGWNHNECDTTSITSGRHQGNQSISFPIKRRSISIYRSSSMPIQTSPLVPGAFPSFVSVFGSRGSDLHEDIRDGGIIDPIIQGGSHSQEKTTTTTTTTATTTTISSASSSSSKTDAPRKALYSLPLVYGSQVPKTSTNTLSSTVQYSLPGIFQHRRGASISSDSTDSSPTTTSSTFDSPSITDPSPSSSPESPSSTLPLSPFKVMMKSSTESEPAQDNGRRRPTVAANAPEAARPEASSSRNVKNLSLATSGMPTRPATSSGIESSYALSTPFSPFKGPLRTGRRKPTNLSIQTPGIEKTSFFGSASEIPSTPSERPSLRHFPTSPALPSLMSPLAGPAGGMRLGATALDRIHSTLGSHSSLSNQSVNSRSLHDLREADEHHRPLKSQETQERGYPNGPIQVYDSGVFLYLEPNREEASRFDTVINVAKEIKNPFADLPDNGHETVMSVWRSEKDTTFISEPQTAVSEISFKSAFEWPEAPANASPTTPKASNPPGTMKQPEYIHVRWDHNSELIDDLLPLCQIIDNRTSAGKTVLIHCQLGVSRSASLVLAYGLYKGYQPDFHAMYGAVKERSQWISPNMSLIYQLMDFRTKVERGQFSGVIREPPAEWFVSHNITPPPDAKPVATTPIVPPKPLMTSTSTQTDDHFAIKKPDAKLMKPLPPVPLFPKDDDRENGPVKDSVMADTTSSADSTRTVFPASISSYAPAGTSSNRSAPRPLPLRELSAPPVQSFDIPPHHSTPSNRLRLTIARPKPQMDLAMQDVPDTPSLFSPRQAEFMVTPFSNTIAGDLAVNGNRRNSSRLPSQMEISSPAVVDPRSPHQRSEAGEILRSIDDVL
jgi:tyrosine-protein phosphatase